jgi:hypothetical protein
MTSSRGRYRSPSAQIPAAVLDSVAYFAMTQAASWLLGLGPVYPDCITSLTAWNSSPGRFRLGSYRFLSSSWVGPTRRTEEDIPSALSHFTFKILLSFGILDTSFASEDTLSQIPLKSYQMSIAHLAPSSGLWWSQSTSLRMSFWNHRGKIATIPNSQT